jgi:hypothetical protein
VIAVSISMSPLQQAPRWEVLSTQPLGSIVTAHRNCTLEYTLTGKLLGTMSMLAVLQGAAELSPKAIEPIAVRPVVSVMLLSAGQAR